MKSEWMPLVLNKVTVLIQGEPGVGKSTLAKKIHENSNFKSYPFVHLNVASISPTLFESEIFGYEQGAFTGAIKRKQGFCETVALGTLFLDEIGELDLCQQSKLLQLLEENIFYPIGSTIPHKFKGRIILATNKNLMNEVKNGKFRSDLWYRINNYSINLLSLEANSEEQISVIHYWIDFYQDHFDKKIIFNREAIEWIYQHRFPGNHRQVRQMVEKIFVFLQNEVTLDSLLALFQVPAQNLNTEMSWPDSYREARKNFEKSYLEQQLKKYHGRINRIAKYCEISKTTLIQKMKEFNLEKESYEF